MKFREYCDYFDSLDDIKESIRACAERHIRDIMSKQVISIGRPSVVIFESDSLLVRAMDLKLEVLVSSYKSGTSLCLEVLVNDRVYSVLINPLYFREEHIKNYLRNCEIDIRNQFRNIRKISM